MLLWDLSNSENDAVSNEIFQLSSNEAYKSFGNVTFNASLNNSYIVQEKGVHVAEIPHVCMMGKLGLRVGCHFSPHHLTAVKDYKIHHQ
ncbi:UNVERIFIED_CONTAM: hypothetical protein NCL1_44766 [Trichonephila clavipes]